MREIATLQLGSYANFVGAHLWNFQDELMGLAADMESDPIYQQPSIDMDVLYRAGESRQGAATYTPRLLAVDLRGSLGAVHPSHDGHSESSSPAISTWSGRVELQKAEAPRKNKFLERLEAEGKGESTDLSDETVIESLDNEVSSWTDFLKVQLHPRSLYEMEGIWSGITPFADFGSGKDRLTETSREDLLDKFRLIAEECDHMQGIQTIVDDSGGFAATATEILTEFADNYGDVTMMLFTVRPPDTTRSIGRSLHDAVSLACLSSFGDVLVPLGLPQLAASDFSRYLMIDDSKHFHTSAVYAAALHSSTLAFRMLARSTQAGGCDMNTLTTNLSYASRKVVRLDGAFPAPNLSGEVGLNLFTLTPDAKEEEASSGDPYAVQSLAIHGARLEGSPGSASVSKVLELVASGKGSHVAFSPCPLPVPLPFPSIFGPFVRRYGDIGEADPACVSSGGRGAVDVFSVPLATRLSSDRAVLPYLKRRQADLERLGLRRGPGVALLTDWGVSREETEEMRESIANLAASFTPEEDF